MNNRGYQQPQAYRGPQINSPMTGNPSVDSPLDTVKQLSSKIEDTMDIVFDPIKPYVVLTITEIHAPLINTSIDTFLRWADF